MIVTSFVCSKCIIIYLEHACLIDRQSRLWIKKSIDKACDGRHMLETCRKLRRLCCKHSNNVARHDKTPIKSTLLSRDMSFMSHGSDIML